VTAIISSLIW